MQVAEKRRGPLPLFPLLFFFLQKETGLAPWHETTARGLCTHTHEPFILMRLHRSETKLAGAPRAPRGFLTTAKGGHVRHSPCRGDLAESTSAVPKSKRECRFPLHRIRPPLPTSPSPIHAPNPSNPDLNHEKQIEKHVLLTLSAERSISSRLRAGESLAMSTSSREKWTKTTPKLLPWKFHLRLFHARPHAGVAPEAPGPSLPRPPLIHSAGSRSSAPCSAGSGSLTCWDLQARSRGACGLRALIS